MNDKYEEGFIPFAYIDETGDDYCQCGVRLVVSYTAVPYGNTTYPLQEYYCPNCD